MGNTPMIADIVDNKREMLLHSGSLLLLSLSLSLSLLLLPFFHFLILSVYLDLNQMTPLLMAASCGHLDICSILMMDKDNNCCASNKFVGKEENEKKEEEEERRSRKERNKEDLFLFLSHF